MKTEQIDKKASILLLKEGDLQLCLMGLNKLLLEREKQLPVIISS